MNNERLIELLAYAEVCFEKCTNPFDLTHLRKKKVTADECKDLSHEIADIIEDTLRFLTYGNPDSLTNLLEGAEEEFGETQEEK